MVADNLIDIRESFLPMWMRGLRCIACGDVVDPLIVHNRMRQLKSDARISAQYPAKAA
jgi:hypothetical protein